MPCTRVDMEGWRFKEEGEDCSADTIDWEAFEVQEVPALPQHLTASWELIHPQDPDTGHWEEFFACPEEGACDEARRSAPTLSQGAGGASSPGTGGAPPQTNVTSNRRLQQTQAQVNEVVDIMRVNVDKVLERDQKLSELDNRADALQAGASQFETSAAKLKRKYWWKNCKMMIILGVVCAVILIIIIIYFST
nr:vesicle-associated membrane protein 2-like [Pogona vitticeps]